MPAVDIDAQLKDIDNNFGAGYKDKHDPTGPSLGCCGKCQRYFLMGSNYLFLFIGISIIVAGLVNAGSNISALLSSVIVAIFILGAAIMLVALFGCFGAKSQNRCLLGVYVFIVGVLAIVLMAGGGYMMGADPEPSITSLWLELDNEVKVNIQDTFDCCGLYNDAITSANATTTFIPSDPGTPCPTAEGSDIGCMDVLISQYDDFFVTTGLAAVFIGLIMCGLSVVTASFVRKVTALGKDAKAEDI